MINKAKYDIKKEQEKKFNSVLKSREYKNVLKVFNSKELSSSIGHYFELPNESYKDYIIRQMTGEKSKEIIDAIKLYLPKEIPIHD